MAEFELQNTTWEWWIRPKTAYCNGRMWLGGMDDQGAVRLDVIAADGTCQREAVAQLGISVTGADDHNSAAVLAIPGKVPLVFYSKHDLETSTRYNRGTDSASVGLRTLGPPLTVDWGVPASPLGCSYPHVFYVGDEVHLLTRMRTSGNSGRYYNYVRSTDWAVTWGTPRAFLDVGAGISQVYPAMQNVNGILRMGFGMDPDGTNTHDTFYFEIELATGKIYKPEAPGTSIGNVQTGVGLPVTYTSASTVRTCPGGLRANFFDTSGGTTPQVTWVEFDETDTQGTAMYYLGSYVGGSWVVNPVCSSGREFAQSVSGKGGYMGGCHFTNVSNSDLILSRRAANGTWTIERWHSNDNGATWDTPVVIASDPVNPLVRPFQIEGATGVYKAVYERITRYGTSIDDLNGYNDWKASLIVTTL